MVKFAMEYYKKVNGDPCCLGENTCVFFDYINEARCINHPEVDCPLIFGKAWVHDVEKRKRELGAV